MSESESEATFYPIITAFTVPLEPGDLQWLGTLSVLWAHLEYCVEASIYSLQGLTNDEGRKTVLSRDISKKATKLWAVAGDHSKGAEKLAFQALADRVVAVAPSRNLAVHGWWSRLADHENVPAAVSWFKVPVGDVIKRITPGEIPAVVAETGAISRGLYDLLEARGHFVRMAE